jgi:hypothetical protein
MMQTYETYRFTVGDNVMLSFDGARRSPNGHCVFSSESNEKYPASKAEWPIVGTILSQFFLERTKISTALPTGHTGKGIQVGA